MGRPNQSQPNLSLTSVIQKSEGLSERASAEWDRLVNDIEAAGVKLSAIHRVPLTLAATIAADIKAGWAAVEKDGAYIMTKAGLQAHPASKRIDALRRDYTKVLAMLGLKSAIVEDGKDEESLEDVIGD